MPRRARLDAPGALHRVVCRGIERQPIFRDDTGRESFVDRPGAVLTATGTVCHAWALLPNHVQLLLQTAPVPLPPRRWAPRGRRSAVGKAAHHGERDALEHKLSFPDERIA